MIVENATATVLPPQVTSKSHKNAKLIEQQPAKRFYLLSSFATSTKFPS